MCNNKECTINFSSNLQIYILKKGRLSLTVGGICYDIRGGEICVVDSYEVYQGIVIEEGSQLKEVAVPFRLLGGFNAMRKNMAIKNRVIKNRFICDELYALVERYVEGDCSHSVRDSAITFILSLVCDRLTFGDERYGEDSALIRKILTYLHANYKGGASLKGVSQALGYTEAHVSRVFHKYAKTNLTAYVNKLRYDDVQANLLKSDGKKITDIIYEAGFKSQQTYYRFKKTLDD